MKEIINTVKTIRGTSAPFNIYFGNKVKINNIINIEQTNDINGIYKEENIKDIYGMVIQIVKNGYCFTCKPNNENTLNNIINDINKLFRSNLIKKIKS